MPLDTGQSQQDDWLMKRGGFRTDINLTGRDSLTVQGDIYNGFTKRFFYSPEVQRILHHYTYLNGFNVLARWQREISNGEMILQTYYDLTERDQKLIVKERRGTYDLDFQHRWQRNDRQEFIWGLGFRYVHDELESDSIIITFNPSQRQRKIFSGFVQAEITLQPERWKLILGSKFEHNDYTGFEYQPTARLLWTPYDKHSAWAAVSRAVRTPSRYDEDSEINVQQDDFKISISGDSDFQS
jgi:iron complex outermembrane receptor protein